VSLLGVWNWDCRERALEKYVKVKAVFFDIDDTLFDSTRLARISRINAVKAMIECGLPLNDVMTGYNLLMKIVEKYGSNYSHHFDRLLEILGYGWDAKIIAAGIVAYHDTKIAYLKRTRTNKLYIDVPLKFSYKRPRALKLEKIQR